jgi:hypothetical protein
MESLRESLRESLDKLDKSLKSYSPLMSKSTEARVETVIKYGAVFAEVGSPIRTLGKPLKPFS